MVKGGSGGFGVGLLSSGSMTERSTPGTSGLRRVHWFQPKVRAFHEETYPGSADGQNPATRRWFPPFF